MRRIQLLSPSCNWSWNTARYSNLPKVTQPSSSRERIWTTNSSPWGFSKSPPTSEIMMTVSPGKQQMLLPIPKDCLVSLFQIKAKGEVGQEYLDSKPHHHRILPCNEFRSLWAKSVLHIPGEAKLSGHFNWCKAICYKHRPTESPEKQAPV